MRLPGYAGQIQDKGKATLNKKGVKEAIAIYGAPFGRSALATAETAGMTDISGDLAEKVGLGMYKPDLGDIDETAFRDTSRSNRLVDELERQRYGAKKRDFRGSSSAELGDFSTMDAAQIATDPQNQMRQGQQDLIAALQLQAAGEGPSLAAMQMEDARQGNIAQAMALGASQRGLSAGQGLRSIADQTQNANQMAARDAMRGRIAEQLAARQQLGGVLQGARGQDIGLAMEQAALEQQAATANQAVGNQFTLQQGAFDQQTALANQQAGLQAESQQDALIQALNQQIGGLEMGQQGSLQDLERLKISRGLGIQDIKSGAYGNRQKALTNVLNSFGQGAATLLAN